VAGRRQRRLPEWEVNVAFIESPTKQAARSLRRNSAVHTASCASPGILILESSARVTGR
jgi:hypothetical protein